MQEASSQYHHGCSMIAPVAEPTKAESHCYGVYYAAKMKAFFESVLYAR